MVERCGPDRFCVPSPSLLQLTVDLLAAGIESDRVLELLVVVGRATGSIADAVVATLAERPDDVDTDRLVALATRGRGLLAHGTGRLTIHTIGRRLGIDGDATAADGVRRLLEDQ
jgi:hypothetical protein